MYFIVSCVYITQLFRLAFDWLKEQLRWDQGSQNTTVLCCELKPCPVVVLRNKVKAVILSKLVQWLGGLQRCRLSLQLTDSPVTPPMFLLSSWKNSRDKTPAKSLQGRAFSFGKPLLPATSSPSPSHATSPGQILSQFPGHIEAVLWPPLPCCWCHDKKTQTKTRWAGKSHSSYRIIVHSV